MKNERMIKMALTSNQCQLIEAVANNDMHKARKAAIACCVEDQSKKNLWFVNRYEKILRNNGHTILGSIPDNLKYKLVGELPESFIESRYYLSDTERAIYNRIHRMRVASKKMASLDISYKNATLLYGESGTGKTMFGKYVAYKMNLPFFYINFSQMIQSHLGETASNIQRVFDWVQLTPCVFMIDEIDCIAMRRSNNGGTGADGELERTTISIMQALDTLPNSTVLIAATNRIDMLDSALLSRFPEKHKIEAFSEDESMKMVNMFLKDISESIQFISDDEIKDIIRKYRVQRPIMNEIKKKIGDYFYENLDESELLDENVDEDLGVALYEVEFTYKVNITAEGMDEALQRARHDFQANSYKATSNIKRI